MSGESALGSKALSEGTGVGAGLEATEKQHVLGWEESPRRKAMSHSGAAVCG